MRRYHLYILLIVFAFLLASAPTASAQLGQLRGSVKLIGADGTAAPLASAAIDVYRTDISGEYHTKTDKKGEWVFAGLPFVGTYVVSVSAAGAAPQAKSGVKAGREIPVDVTLAPGDGRKLTQAEALDVSKGGGASAATSGGGSESTTDRAKREEMIRKNKEIEETNKKNTNINQVVGEAFKAGNAALAAKNYDEALKQYDMGLAADPEQPALLTNKTLALKARGVEKYNVAIQTKDEAARNSGLEAAKADFKAAAEAANKAADLLKKVPAATDPEEQKQQTVNKYAALSARAEAMRLFVTKADPLQADAAAAAFQDYIAVETDAAKKSKAQLDMAQMLLDAGAGDKAFAEFQKIIGNRPDDPDANLGAGLALFSTGDKTKYQEAANYLQHFVDKALDSHKFKADAIAILKELKSTENVVPEKTTPARRKRP